MKSTGILRRFDDLGRIVIPKEIRKKLFGEAKSGYGMGEGKPMEIFLDIWISADFSFNFRFI